MAAPKGNQFWKLRSKHGRDKLFETPDLLWQAACEYFEWVEENPLKEAKAFSYMGEVSIKEMPLMRAMTLSQLCFYLGTNEDYFNQFKRALKDKTDDTSKDFSRVLTDIEKIIYNQKFQGASANLLNANIIARDLGLKDSSDITTNGKDLPTAVSPFASEKDESDYQNYLQEKYNIQKKDAESNI